MARCMEPDRDDMSANTHTNTDDDDVEMVEETENREMRENNELCEESEWHKDTETHTFVIQRMQNTGARNVGKHVCQPIDLRRDTRRDQTLRIDIGGKRYDNKLSRGDCFGQ